MRKIFILFFVFLTLIFPSCTKNPLKVDISDIKLSLSINRLDQRLFEVTPLNEVQLLPQLEEEFGEFFPLYNFQIIRLGDPNAPQYTGYLQTFLTDPMITQCKLAVDSAFADIHSITEELTTAFRYYKYHFPGKQIPQIYTYISGFNQSVVMAQGMLGIGLDNYLGADAAFYKQLALPQYKRINMHQQHISIDAMLGWAISEFPFDETNGTLLDNMIHQGKMLYFLDAMFPKKKDYQKMGYTPEQQEWCDDNEGAMWTFLVEKRELFKNDYMNTRKYISDGPYTSNFTDASPGKTGVWIGWQIVRHYMEKNPNISLSALMAETDALKILNQSGYAPN